MPASQSPGSSRTRVGLDRLVEGGWRAFRGLRAGLLCHPASVTHDLVHAPDALLGRTELGLAALFGPQHGARGDTQDNMVETADARDGRLGLPVWSLYGDVRKPTPAMLQGLDVLFVDLVDVGCRVYTFQWTLALAMEACGEAGVRVVVLDRPNPIGGTAREGRVLKPGFESFVGLHPLPLRTGLTLGEVARWLVASRGVRCDLEVIPCEGWSRDLWHDGTGAPWVLPSPNLPTLDSATVFPGTVLLEGTRLSEGRGTTRPFEVAGAPWLDGHGLAEQLTALDLPGVRFRPAWFEPTFQKHAGRTCGGVQLHVTDRDIFRPVETAVALLAAARAQAPSEALWRQPPYEYEAVKPPIDILWGGDDLRRGVEAGRSAREILAPAAAEISAFEAQVGPSLLY